MKKIELNILTIIITEAVYLLLFFKTNLISILLGITLGIILIYLTKNIKKNNITRILLLILTIPLFIYFLYQIINFISYNILTNYSLTIIFLSLLSITIYLGNKNYHSFIKTVEIIAYIIIFIKIISFILCIPLINFNNITIIFTINKSFIYISLFILFLYKYLCYLTNYKINNKIIILSFINPIIIKIISILILSNNLSNIYKYPYVNYLKRIKYLNFIERMDGILSFEYLFCFIILLIFIIQNIKVLKKPING